MFIMFFTQLSLISDIQIDVQIKVANDCNEHDFGPVSCRRRDRRVDVNSFVLKCKYF